MYTLLYTFSTFSNKLLIIDTSYNLTTVQYSSLQYVHSFYSFSNIDIYNLVITVNSKSHLVTDTISLFQYISSFLTHIIYMIVNDSLSNGTIHYILKGIVVLPLMKKYLDNKILSNIRSISQLTFISKRRNKLWFSNYIIQYLLHFNILKLHTFI